MKTLPANTEKQLPTIDELYKNKDFTAKQTALQIILNHPPDPSWVKENEGIKYIPIGIVEFLLTSIFRKWWVEVRTVQLIANSIVTTVRLHVIDPLTGEETYQDGIGATPVQTKAGAGATEFDKIGTFAVQKAAPASESYAIKDAAEKFGKLFGADIQRKEGFTINPVNAMERKFKITEND